MKYFDSNKNDFWGSKINFADENNVLVGFDFGSSCCEQFGWYVDNKVTPKDAKDSIICDNTLASVIDQELEGWVFDKEFFEEHDAGEDSYDVHNVAVFRMVKEGNERFLHLFNDHNGYYGHGFEFAVDGTMVVQGSL
jgi:hypothetical protein